jgi:hypothetical protein
MPIEIHTVEKVEGSSFVNSDRLILGLFPAEIVPAGPGSIASVAVSTAGNYPGPTIPTASLGAVGAGSGATLSARMKLQAATLTTPGASGYYAPADTITLSGGTSTSAAIATVSTTKVVSATVVSGHEGSGGTDGTQTVTGTTGTGTKFQASVTVTSGAISAVNSITVAGSYTANPTTPTAEPVTGGALTGAQLDLVIGVSTFTISTAGVYSALPSGTMTQASTTGNGLGAVFTPSSWGVNSIVVGGAGGTYYPYAGVTATMSGGSPVTAGVLAAPVVSEIAGESVTVHVSGDFPTTYAVSVTTEQDAVAFVSNKLPTGFDVTINPRLSTGTLTAGYCSATIFG